jgi:C-terminal processing protease CtpA/Prc
VRIVKVVEQSPAERGGLRPGDCILRINGVRTVDNIGVLGALAGAIEGESVELEVSRNGRILGFSIEAERRG